MGGQVELNFTALKCCGPQHFRAGRSRKLLSKVLRPATPKYPVSDCLNAAQLMDREFVTVHSSCQT